MTASGLLAACSQSVGYMAIAGFGREQYLGMVTVLYGTLAKLFTFIVHLGHCLYETLFLALRLTICLVHAREHVLIPCTCKRKVGLKMAATEQSGNGGNTINEYFDIQVKYEHLQEPIPIASCTNVDHAIAVARALLSCDRVRPVEITLLPRKVI